MTAATIGARAARTLVTELSRRPGPKTGLVVGAVPGGAVLDAAIAALEPEDRLTVQTDDPALRAGAADLGSWVAERVRVVDTLGEAAPAEVVLAAQPVTGTAEDARATVAALAKLVTPGGVLAVATVAVPGVAAGAAAELDRQALLYGAGTDLVLRNAPPLRVHRLRWTPPDPALASRLAPAARPSSIPLTPATHLDSHGVVAGAATLGLAAATRLARPRSRAWLLPAAAALPVMAFFRDPEREPPEDPSLVVAASDGTVRAVERVTDDRFTEDGSAVDYLRVAVFLSVLDVHINRAPVPGTVVDHFLTDGGHALAMADAAAHNVSAYTVLATPRGRVVVAQRTGLLARRIVHRAPVGSVLAHGERFGLIRFGSRTDVYLPADAVEPLVAPSERVTGGVTPIARWR